MLFYNTKTKVVVNVEELKKALYPMTLARELTKEALAGTDFVLLTKGTRPTATVIQKVVEDAVVQIGKDYQLSYKVVDKYSGVNKTELEAAALASEKKEDDKNTALSSLQETSVAASPTIKELAARIKLIEQYLKV